MKKRIIAAVAAFCACMACLPLASGCKSGTDYILKSDENGEKYYSVKCSGLTSSLRGEYVIPAEYGEGEDRAPVKEIEQEGFAGTSLTKITVPKTVTKLGNAAFAYNNSLSEVVFEDGIELEEISRGAFGYCKSLRSLQIPESVKSVGYMSFYSCSGLLTAEFPSGLESIGGLAFEYCTSLSEIEFPDGLMEIGDGAFSGCTSLTQVILPGTLRDRTEPVLDENGGQKKDEDGNPLNTVVYGLGCGAFHSCTSLTSAVLGEGIKTVSPGAFGYCTALTAVYLPASLEKIQGAAYNDGEFYTGHAFHSDAALTDVYYSGTREQWTAFQSNIVSEPVNEAGYVYNNDALLNALRHYEAKYNG